MLSQIWTIVTETKPSNGVGKRVGRRLYFHYSHFQLSSMFIEILRRFYYESKLVPVLKVEFFSP